MSDTVPANSSQGKLTDDFNIDQQLDKSADFTKNQLSSDPALAQSLSPDPQIQTVMVDIEEQLLKEIMSRIDKDVLTEEKARDLAREFLSILPVMDQQDLLTKLKSLSDKNQEVKGIYLKYASAHEENDRHTRLSQISEHLNKGDIEKALHVAKGGTTNA